MSFAAETTITVPSGGTQIGELRAADLFLGAGPDLRWNQYELKSAESQSGRFEMIYVDLDDGKTIIATPDQLFLLFSRELVRADALKAGDALAGGYGQRVEVVASFLGEYHGEICEIATASPEPVNGHFVQADGVVVGDFDLEIGSAE